MIPACQDTEAEEEEEQITWSCGDCIGHGAFGKVFLGLNTVSGNLMAVKQVSPFLSVSPVTSFFCNSVGSLIHLRL